MGLSTAFNQKIPSLTEWMEKIQLPNILEFRNEDNCKYDRLRSFSEIVGVKYNVPISFSINEIKNNSPRFLEENKKRAGTKINLRVIPIAPNFPKVRVRALPFEEALKWFFDLKIEETQYSHVEIIKYNEKMRYSAIFLINDGGIWGEAISGDLWQLAFGMQKDKLTLFSFSNGKWNFSGSDEDMNRVMRESIRPLRVDEAGAREKLRLKLGTEFNPDGYAKGYYEFVVWPDEGALFMDYNRVIYRQMKDFSLYVPEGEVERVQNGLCASPGMAHGRVRIVTDPKNSKFEEDEILICEMTTLDYLPFMKKARAIITEKGNVLSHAAIVSRELHKPCVVMAKGIMKRIKTGDEIFIDAGQGKIIITAR